MKLNDYLSMKNLTYRDFAELPTMRVNPSTVWLWLAGRRRPNLEMIKRIKVATGGEVRPEDF